MAEGRNEDTSHADSSHTSEVEAVFVVLSSGLSSCQAVMTPHGWISYAAEPVGTLLLQADHAGRGLRSEAAVESLCGTYCTYIR